MPSFPVYYNPQESLDNDKKIYSRLFQIEKKDPDVKEVAYKDTNSSVTSVASKDIKHIVDADQVIALLEKDIGQANSFMLEIDENLKEWDKYHRRQYVPLEIPHFEEPLIKRPEDRGPNTVPKTPKFLIQGNDESDEEFFTRKETPEYIKLEEAYLKKFKIWEGQNNDYDEILQNIGDYDEYHADYQDRKNAWDAKYRDRTNAIPLRRRFQNKDERETVVHLKHFEPIAKSLFTTIAKTMVIINNIKIIYKHKISGNNLNRFTQDEMFKIRTILEEFFNATRLLNTAMNQQKLQTSELDKPKLVNTNIYHIFFQAETKFKALTIGFEKIYLDDKKRYSYNQGKI